MKPQYLREIKNWVKRNPPVDGETIKNYHARYTKAGGCYSLNSLCSEVMGLDEWIISKEKSEFGYIRVWRPYQLYLDQTKYDDIVCY